MIPHQTQLAAQERDSLKLPEVTVAVTTYNGMNVISECLESIKNQDYPSFKIIVANNASTDNTVNWINQNYPEIEVIELPENNGPNPARNLAIKLSDSELVLLVDDDSVLEEKCISELINAYRRFPDAAVWSPRIIYYEQKETIQFEGVCMHYLCEAILLSPDRPVKDGVNDITPIQIAGGVSYLLSREKALAVNLFDEDYFFGRTDGEFTFRLTLAGFRLYTVPKALCYHRVKKRGVSKVYYQIRNRWHVILTAYSWRTIFFISPSLILYECSLAGFLILKGAGKNYFKAMLAVVSNLVHILKKRTMIQAIKKLPDREILHCEEMNIRADLVENKIFYAIKSILDRLFCFYWQAIKRII